MGGGSTSVKVLHQKMNNDALTVNPIICMAAKSEGDMLVAHRKGVVTVETVSPSVTSQPSRWCAYHVV